MHLEKVDDETFRLWVADNGVGIREDKLDAIFNPFVQAEGTTFTQFGGTGLDYQSYSDWCPKWMVP